MPTVPCYVGLFFWLTLWVTHADAQDSLRRSTDSAHRSARAHRLILGSAAAYGVSMYGLSKLWYSNYPKQSFAFFNDSKEWDQVDKAGHFYSTFQLSRLATYGLVQSGISPRRSTTIGSLAAFVIVSSIEVFDGFSAGYGASPTDLVANASGAVLYWGQERVWNEVRVIPKFSFHTTRYAAMRPEALGSNLVEEMLKDYNGQTYWLSADVDKFFSFPKWLNVAVGYGTEGFVYANRSDNMAAGYTPYRQFYLSLDWDPDAIRTHSRFVKALLNAVRLIHLPAPALEFSQGKVRFRPLYF